MSFFWLMVLVGSAGLAVYLAWVSPRRLLRRIGARLAGDEAEWRQVHGRLAEVARRHRAPVPELWVLPEFSPNALILSPRPGALIVALTEGLVRSLSAEELDCVLSLSFTHGHQRGRVLHTWMCGAFYPLAAAIQSYPLAAQLLLSPVLALPIRMLARPAKTFRADQSATAYQSQWVIAASLQKLAVVGRKVPIKQWNLAMDSLFLLSPLALEDAPLWSPIAQPSVEARRRGLLGPSACESRPSLP